MSATPPLTAGAEHAATATGTFREPCVLLKLGEIVLKGGNRQQFERMLQANIRRALKQTGVGVRLWQRDGVVVLRVADGTSGNGAARGPAAEAPADQIAEPLPDVTAIPRASRPAHSPT